MTRDWVYGCLPMAALLLLLTPVVAAEGSAARLAVWLLLPVYMLHQAEEFDDDRFRRFVNQTILGGREGLTPLAAFTINIGLVWGGFALCLWGMGRWPWVGLIPAYVVLVNAGAHGLAALVLRRGNPGLVTALTLFPAFGGWALWQGALGLGALGLGAHLAALGMAVLGHAAIGATVALRLRRG